MRQKLYQQVGSLFLASRKNAILGDEMGLGKTNQAICAIDLMATETDIKKVLVICPAVLRPQWQDKMSQWLVIYDQYPVQVVETVDAVITGKTVMVSYNLVNKKPILEQLNKIKWDVIIYDEFHFMKNVDAKRTINILGKDGVITQSRHNWFLSGTPVTSKPADLFPVLVTIARKKMHPYTTWLSYIKHFCNAYKDEFGNWQHHGSSNLDELSSRLSTVMLRRMAEDVEPDLGEPLVETVMLELSKEKQIIYDNEEDKLMGDKYQSARLREILASMKWETIYDHLHIVCKNVKKIVVFYHHKLLCRYLQARTDRVSFKIDGSVSVRNRHDIINQFNKSEYGILFAQSDAAGTGVDGLQKSCNVVYFAEIPWNPDVRDQNIKRVLRIGQKNKVKVVIPIIKNSVDERMFSNWSRKENVINTILKGSKNVGRFD